MDVDANTSPTACQVYLRVTEGRNLKGVESNGTSDPLFQIYVDGKSRKLESKHVVGTTAPSWRQEFLLGLESSHSKLEFRVLDWNRFASHESLGSVVVDLSTLRIGTFYDEWRAMDTQGELHVLIHLSRLNMPSPQSLNMIMPKYRIHLERTEYYPGETLRGALVLCTRKKFKTGYIKLSVEGASSVYHENHFAQTLLLAPSGTLLGDVKSTTKVHSPGEGLHLFPFECVLPLTLPHTRASLIPRSLYSIGTNVNLYRVIANMDIPGEMDRLQIAPFRILAHPMHAVLDPCCFTVTPSTKDAPVLVDMKGASVAWAGEQFSLNITIRNNSGSAISHIVVRLKTASWISGKQSKPKWKTFGGEWTLVNEWKFSPDAGTSIAPGQSWTNTVSFNIPSGLDPSMISTLSPLLQTGYTLGVKVCTSDNAFLKTTGSKKMAIAVSDHYSAFDHIEVPVEPQGAIGKIVVAPATPEMYKHIFPVPQTGDGVLKYVGGSLGSIAALPGAHQVDPVPHTKTYGVSLLERFYTTDEEWTAGNVPIWLDPAKKDLYHTK